MVLDNIKNIKNYSSLHHRFELAMEFLLNKASFMDVGVYKLDGDNVYVTIVEVDLKDEKDAKLEVHDRYIDVQTVLIGFETYGYAQRDACVKPVGEIDTTKDILFFDDAKQTTFTVNQGQFLIFYPWDAHAPLIGKGKVVKAIAKVKI